MHKTCKAIFCGGRDYANEGAIRKGLLDLSVHERVVIITGGAPGADTIAHNEALRMGYETEVIEADWAFHGASAGPIRNSQMIKSLLEGDCYRIVYAFGGGRGTNDTIKKAQAAGVKVVQVD